MAQYDEIAGWYADLLRGGSPVHAVTMPSLLSLCGDVAGSDVCDLACGTGIAGRALAARGARVVAIDISEELLALGREEAATDGVSIEFEPGDAHYLHAIAAGRFDGVVCSLSLMDIADLERCLAETARILKSGGWFVFAITHPCFQGPESRWTGQRGGVVKREVRGYFREGPWRSDNPHTVRGRAGAVHRTLSTYLNAVISAGFVLNAVREPQPQDEIANRVPGYAEAAVALVVRCVKRP